MEKLDSNSVISTEGILCCDASLNNTQGAWGASEPSTRLITTLPFCPSTIHTEARNYEIIEEQLDLTTKIDQSEMDTGNIYTRWISAPPDRIHATSPSRLSHNDKPGAPFGFSIQLVVYCPQLNKYVPYVAKQDIVFTASIYGKRKPKTGLANPLGKCNEYVKLLLNPIGKSLLLHNGYEVSQATLKKGQHTLHFRGLALTCGSNAARSKKALAAARVWDWDYHLLVKCVTLNVPVHSLMSKHLTTDSNRSLTREKRKRGDEAESEPICLDDTLDEPSAKKMRTGEVDLDAQIGIATEFSSTEAVHTPFNIGMFDFLDLIF